ncbi:hypothetical protein PIB30_069924 [Stylosanthes scabra]|uniref:Uncharacterized protein n=1 Tax=Stylosanthes scabra TaxID=79078 RepID=A0ABU6SP11_9FABA|nr:hypothetical protein [Stylosanthes scabra]
MTRSVHILEVVLEWKLRVQIHQWNSLRIIRFSCDVDEQNVPKVGMLFQSLEEARNFYKDYAKPSGFAIKIRNTNKSKKSNEILN